MIFEKDISVEVQQAWAIKMRGMSGTDGLKFCQDTVKKYPEHFEEDVKYWKVPDEVHKAYMDEAHPGWDKSLDFKEIKGGDGLMAEIEKGAMKPADFDPKSFREAYEALVTIEQEQKEEDRRQREVWNKHYGKYGIMHNKYYKLIPPPPKEENPFKQGFERGDVRVIGGMGINKNRIAFAVHEVGLLPMFETQTEIMSERVKQLQKEHDLHMAEYETGLTRKEKEAVIVPVRTEPKIERNSPCPCGSGKKYKKCCLK